MKLNPNSTQPPIFENGDYNHPWYEYTGQLKKPKPPTEEAVKKAQFVDKTYHWTGK